MSASLVKVKASLYKLQAVRQVMRDAALRPPELERLVHQRLKAVLVSAYQHVPYYRRLMSSVGYDPVQAYRGPQDLALLPITTRDILNRQGKDALLKESSDLSNSSIDTSSGSTGVPVRIYRDPRERSIQIARWLRVLFANSYSMRDRVMSLTSPTRAAEGRSIVQRLGFLRRRPLDVGRYSPAEMVDILLHDKPDILYGTRSELDLIALDMRGRGIRHQGLKLLVAAGEVIHQSHRRLFRERFGIEPVECYGSVELGVMAYETPARDGLHLTEDLTYFEILDENDEPVAPGQPGRLVATALTRTLMPIIRYDQADLVVVNTRPTGDGIAQRRLTQIIGRDSDYAILPDGSHRLSHDFSRVINRVEGIAQYRAVQQGQGSFRIIVVADARYFDSIHDELQHGFQSAFPPEVNFEIIRVDQLEPDPSGKLRTLVSEIGSGDRA